MELTVQAITGDKKFKAGFRIINEIWVFRGYIQFRAVKASQI